MDKKKIIDWRVICVGMACLTVAELYALSQGINGKLFALFVGVIGAAIGVTIDNPFKK